MKIKISLTVISMVLSGCSSIPTVEYDIIKRDVETKLNGKEIDSYYLAGSVLTISRKQIDGKLTDEVIVNSKPVEFSDFKLLLRRAGPFWTKTNISLVKNDNTELVQEANIEFFNNGAEFITKAGNALVKLVGITGLSSNEITLADLPMEIRLVEKKDNEMGINGAATTIKEPNVSIVINQVPVDAKPLNSLSFPFESNSFIYSACREATITFEIERGKNQKGDVLKEKHVHTVKIADPRFVQLTPFSLKGKMKPHSECGMTVQTDKDYNVNPSHGILEAVATQTQAVINAFKADSAQKK